MLKILPPASFKAHAGCLGKQGAIKIGNISKHLGHAYPQEEIGMFRIKLVDIAAVIQFPIRMEIEACSPGDQLGVFRANYLVQNGQ